MILFVDFEASSLSPHSYPIEIGWCDDTGAGEAYLIRPAESWKDWSVASQGIHGISQEQLHQDGVPHQDVARRVMEVVNWPGIRMVSDAPTFDQVWLNKLLVAAGYRAGAVKIGSAEEVYAEACKPLLRGLSPAEMPRVTRSAVLLKVTQLVREAQEACRKQGPEIHRALADAQALAWILRYVREQVLAECSED
jgi:hypothetical protein